MTVHSEITSWQDLIRAIERLVGGAHFVDRSLIQQKNATPNEPSSGKLAERSFDSVWFTTGVAVLNLWITSAPELLVCRYAFEKERSINRADRILRLILMGNMIEFRKTEKVFANRSDKRTEDYITNRLG